MKTTLDYLNEVIKHASNIENDNQLSTYLGITRQAVYQYKAGQNMSVGVALIVARKLKIPPLEPVAATLYAQAKTEAEREFWKKMYERANRI